MSLTSNSKILLLIVGLGLAAGCAQQAPPTATSPAPAPDTSAAWPAIPHAFIENYFIAQPFFAAQSGRHEFDGQMPDLSATGLRAEAARLRAARATIAGVNPVGLKPSQQLEREVLLNVVDRDLFELEKARWPWTNPAWYLGRLDPDVYLSREYAPLAQRLKAYIGYARAVPAIALAIRENLRTPLPRSYVEYGVKAFGGFADFYRKDVLQAFGSVKELTLQAQLREANTAAATAMQELQAWFVSQRKDANENFAMGTDLFAQMVKDTEMVDLPVAQIEAAGKADLARNTAALTRECARFLPGGTLAACVARMSSDKPKAGAVEAARAQLIELKVFLQQNDIVTIPSHEEARVARSPPYNSANDAFINIPGPYDHGVASIYNISPPDPNWSKADQAAYIPGVAALLNTSVHEVWPGHFLQFLHANANPSKAQALWVGYAYAEGWAHYCEEMMIEKGLGAGDPQLHIAQLRDALLRDVRLLSAIGMHTHGISLAESEKMFKEQAFQDAGNARQQSARGTYDPGYLNYTLGKLMIRKLRSDWIASKRLRAGADEKALWHAFHDQFLSYGGPPIPLVRKEMLGEVGAVL